MILNDETLGLFKLHLASRWAKLDKKPACAMCGSESFAIQTQIMNLTEWNPADPELPMMLPVVPVICNACSFVYFIAAIASRVLVRTDNNKQMEMEL